MASSLLLMAPSRLVTHPLSLKTVLPQRKRSQLRHTAEASLRNSPIGRTEEIQTERKQHRRDRWFAMELNVISLVFGAVLGAVMGWGFSHLLM